MSELTEANRDSLRLVTEMQNRLFGQDSICVKKTLKEAADGGFLMSMTSNKCLQYPEDKNEITDLVKYAYDASIAGKRIELSCADDDNGVQACADFKLAVNEFLATLIEPPVAEL